MLFSYVIYLLVIYLHWHTISISAVLLYAVLFCDCFFKPHLFTKHHSFTLFSNLAFIYFYLSNCIKHNLTLNTDYKSYISYSFL